MKNKFLLFLSVVFLGLGQIWGQTYELVTSNAQLEEGAEYIILGQRSNNTILVMTTTQNNNNRAGVVISGTTLPTTLEAETNYAVFELGLSNGHWTFYDAAYNDGQGGFLYAAGSNSNNHLRTRANDSDGNSRWEINIGNDNIASVVAQGNSTNNVMQLNTSNALFACYASASQAPVYLYKKGAASTDPTLTTSETEITGLGYMEGNASVSQSFSLNGSNLDPASGNITVTAPANFQVSTDNVNFSNSLNIAYSGGTLASTDVYVRLNESLAINTYNGNITISGGGASDTTVSVEGIVTAFSEECGFEDFDKAELTESYANGSFVGNNGITWTYGHSRNHDGYSIDDEGLMLRRASDSYLEATISGGIGTFSFDYRKAYTGGSARQLELLVDGVQVATTDEFGGSSGADATIYNFIYDINTTETVTIRIKNVGSTTSNRQTVIDNITWTCYSGTEPTTPTLTTSVSELTGLNYVFDNGPSASESFVLSGTNLDGSEDITILAGDGFEISLDDADYLDELTLLAYEGTATDIYVRMVAGLAVGDYSDIILLDGYGTDAEVSVSGEVTAPISSLFRSKANGNWTSNATWESSADGTTWWQASTYPDESATDVEIQVDHKVTLNSAGIKIANTEVYGQLEIGDNDFQLMGTGHALKIKNGAELILDGNGKPTSASTGTALIETGGNLKVVSFSGSNDLVSNYLHVGSPSNKFKFEHHSIFEWANNYTLGSTGFEEIFDVVNPGDFVIFRMTQTFGSSYGSSSTNNLFNAVMEIPGDRLLKLQNNGHKTFRGGIQGTGVLTVETTGSGKLIFGDTLGNPILGNTGSLTLNVPHNVLQLQNIEVPSSAQVKIESSGTANPNTFSRIGGNLAISGELDITDMRIVNTADGGITVRDGGALRTEFGGVGTNEGGLYGTHSAIVSGELNLNENSTVEYYGDNQVISNLNYYHLKLSGTGIKSPQSTTSIDTNGSVHISGTPIVDFTGHNLASTGANTTSFTMDGGRLILGIGGTQPNMRGAYNLTGGVIEFANSSASGQTIRSTNAYSYQNIEVTGNSVGTSGGNLVLNENGTFVVKPNGIFTINANSIVGPAGNQTVEIEDNGTFRTGNADGFSDGDGTSNPGQTTSIRNNIENIILHPNSTVEYSRSGDQTITDGAVNLPSDAHYQNLRISGSGVKTAASGNLIVNNITYVDAATLRVAETNDDVAPNVLTARKGIQVASGASALFENNANLMQDADAVNSGNIIVERFVQDMNNDMETQMDYVYWSSPVEEQSIQTFSPASQYKLWYNESNDYFYYIPSTEPNFIPAKGYAFSAENDKPNGYDETYQFIGTPQNDVVTIPIKRSPDSVIDGITYEHGSNLVGNPYPSTIDAELLYELNQDNIDFHFEFWTNESYTPEQQGSGYSNNNYAILTEAGLAPPSENQATYDFDNENTIKIGQGFIVKKTEIGEPVDLVFDNSIRLPESGHFYHRNNLNNEKDRFWLTFTSPNQMLNTALIGYFPNATDDFDRNFDALSPVSSDAIFTLLGEDKLCIQGLEYPLELTDEIPLGVKSHTQGVGSIYLRRAEGIFENAQTIYLRDNYENIIHNLSEGPYEFELEEGETLDRFEIIFQEDEVMSTSDLLANSIKIYHADQNIVIESEKEKILSVEVYDLNGRKVHSKDRINSNLYQIRKTSLATQVFVVKVLTDGGKVETRKIINQ